MSYCLLSPIYWERLDPPPMAKGVELECPARMVLRPGLLAGPGLEMILGRYVFDRCVEDGLLEPIP